MGQKNGSNAVFFVIRRFSEAPVNQRKTTLCESLSHVKESITDSEIWEIIDFFNTKKINRSEVIEAVITSGAQSADATLSMLRMFKYKETLCQKALEVYSESLHFRETLFSATESSPLLQKRLVEHSNNYIIGKLCNQVC